MHSENLQMILNQYKAIEFCKNYNLDNMKTRLTLDGSRSLRMKEQEKDSNAVNMARLRESQVEALKPAIFWWHGDGGSD